MAPNVGGQKESNNSPRESEISKIIRREEKNKSRETLRRRSDKFDSFWVVLIVSPLYRSLHSHSQSASSQLNQPFNPSSVLRRGTLGTIFLGRFAHARGRRQVGRLASLRTSLVLIAAHFSPLYRSLHSHSQSASSQLNQPFNPSSVRSKQPKRNQIMLRRNQRYRKLFEGKEKTRAEKRLADGPLFDSFWVVLIAAHFSPLYRSLHSHSQSASSQLNAWDHLSWPICSRARQTTGW
jgi:hypothetical protein